MDKSTLIGFIAAVVLIAGSMALGGSIMMYVDVQSVLIVIGGTIATAMIKERMHIVFGSIGVAMQTIKDGSTDVSVTIERVLELAKIARASGVLALENEEVPTDFMKKGLRLLTDGMAAEELRATLQTERLCLNLRHARGRDVFKFMSGNAPAMGMIGTLVGLVAMLQTLNDPAAIGPAMAIALLTTLYGALIAFVVCGPIAEKLDSRTKEESMAMEVVLEGYVSIAKGDNPMIIREKLNGYLAPKDRKSDDD